MPFRHVGTRERACWLLPLGVRIALWFVCALFIAILGFGLFDVYTTGEVDPAWPVVTVGLLWMVYDIRGRQ